MIGKIRILRTHPRFLLSRLNRFLTGINSEFHRRFVSHDGVNMMEQDWDNLLILDACRYDDFEELSTLPGQLMAQRSLASDSPEWYETNVGDTEYFDTVVVSANPYTAEYLDRFHASQILWTDEHWNESLRAVPPDVVARAAAEMHTAHPDKRLLVHFMQPHYPPIGPSRHELPVGGNPPEESAADDPLAHLGMQTYLRGQVDGVTDERARQAYRENLQIVLDVVPNLLETLDGKTIITADHGNLFGERLYPIPVRGVLHPRFIRSDPLVTVPWLVVPYEERRGTVAEEPLDQEFDIDEDTLEDRLAALGYRE